MGGTVLILRPCPDAEDTWTPGLEQIGYTVLYAEEPLQALVHIRSASVDIVVIDSPDDDGLRVSNFVEQLAEEHNAPPFVLASASPLAPSHSAKLGAAAFIPKPCGAGDIGHVISRMKLTKPSAVSIGQSCNAPETTA